MARNEPLPRPVVRWAGGKASSVDAILRAIPVSFSDYHEPFFGGGAVFFALFRAGRIKKKALLSDSNAELIDAHIAIRDSALEVTNAIRDMRPERIDEARYKEVLALDTTNMTPIERAARFLFLNKTCFNGLYRVNSKGAFNTSWGKIESWKPDFANIFAVSEALQCATLVCSDFFFAQLAQKNDVVYLDPPYFPSSETADFTSYTASGFALDDQLGVASLFAELARRGAHVIASNADVPAARSIYGIVPGVRFAKLQIPRAINSDGAKRGRVGELLITHERSQKRARARQLVDDRQVEMFGGAA